jgi:hypothetical protein
MTVGNIVAFTGFGNIEPLNTLENEPASKFMPYRSVYLPRASALPNIYWLVRVSTTPYAADNRCSVSFG